MQIKIGNNTAIHMGCFFTGKEITIGNNSVINRNCRLDGRYGLIIGNNVSISPECYILSLTHDANSSMFKTIGKKVYIEDYSWLGIRCIILPGVRVSRGCVIGAGSVVTKDIPALSIVGGVPSRKIGMRKDVMSYSIKYFPLFDTDECL